MELTIKIEDPEFEKSIIDGVKNIKPEELSNIVCRCIEAFLMKDSNIKDLIMQKPYYRDQYIPTDWFKGVFGAYEGDDNKINEMRNDILKYIHDNYHELVFNAMVRALSEQLLKQDFRVALNTEFMKIDHVTGYTHKE